VISTVIRTWQDQPQRDVVGSAFQVEGPVW